ncbi:MAG: ASPIC/UnbV domain-containing protein, partial [Phycisphaerales bacterium]
EIQPSQHYRQPALLFWNCSAQASSCFAVVPEANLGDLSRPIVGRGAAYADIDGDGDQDVLLTQTDGAPLLLRNDQRLGRHWLRVKLIGRQSNRDAIGARLELTAGGLTQRRQVMPTCSYLSQVELPITFGLGDSTRVDSLRVIWPDGSLQTIAVDDVDRTITVVQRSG